MRSYKLTLEEREVHHLPQHAAPCVVDVRVSVQVHDGLVEDVPTTCPACGAELTEEEMDRLEAAAYAELADREASERFDAMFDTMQEREDYYR